MTQQPKIFNPPSPVYSTIGTSVLETHVELLLKKFDCLNTTASQ